jgi:hypothetical protein
MAARSALPLPPVTITLFIMLFHQILLRRRSKSRYAVRHVRPFERGNLVSREFQGKSRNRILQMIRLRRADNRLRHPLLLEKPGQRNLRARHTSGGRHGAHLIDNQAIGLRKLGVELLAELVGFLA